MRAVLMEHKSKGVAFGPLVLRLIYCGVCHEVTIYLNQKYINIQRI